MHESNKYLSCRYLQYAFDTTKIKSQDTSSVISYVANSNPIGRHFAWNFLKEMWPTILEKYVENFEFEYVGRKCFRDCVNLCVGTARDLRFPSIVL